jgi:hypothetical protein
VLGELAQEALVVQVVPAPYQSSPSLLQDVYAQVELDANGVPLGIISVEAVGVDPRPCEDVGSLLRDFVVHGVDLGTVGRATLGDAIPTHDSSGAVGPGITGLLLSGPPVLHPCRSTGGRWRTTQSTRVRWSPPGRGCCDRRWPKMVGISCIRFELV